MRHEAQFPAVRGSVPSARRFVAGAVADVPPEVSDAVALIATELASNSVQHAASAFAIRIEQLPDRIRIEVEDDGAGQPVLASPGPGATSGRGLQIVSALADGWGVIPKDRAEGKTVWVTIALRAEDTGKEPESHESHGHDGRATPHPRRSGSPGSDGAQISAPLAPSAPGLRRTPRYCRIATQSTWSADLGSADS
jgi:anti-sigma regulatory factor (Ser/Thr protein kinase)